MGVKLGGTVQQAVATPSIPEPPDVAAINKQQYLDTMRLAVKREGLEEFLAWLETTDFFEAPASTKYHGNFKGGLCAHSLNVLKRALELATVIFGSDVDENDIESITLAALCHDICKANYYTVELRNKKDHVTPDGITHPGWHKFPEYIVRDLYPAGHGEKSVILIMKHMKLKDDEIAAINFHMAGHDDRNYAYGGSRAITDAMNLYPLLVLISCADQVAAFIDGV